jgi:hypothetical protein
MQHSFARRSLRAATLALALAGAVQAQAATHRALIVGVSDYQSLPARSAGGTGPFDLEGPKNDVPRMLQLARQLGVPATELHVLANAGTLPPGAKAPTRANILAELKDLAARSSTGDQVLVYFSGHGAQAPDMEGEEADGLDELLLPADIGKWSDDADLVENAITDDEFGAAIEAIRQRGAYVWVIVDSCHSGTALRGGPVALPTGFESKGVSSTALGVPAAKLQQAQAAARARGGKFEAGGDDVRADSGGGVVAFYAATAEEAAIGGPQPLPDGGRSPSTSLLTWAITDAMVGGNVPTYRELALRVRGYYDALGRAAPEPAFEGDFDRATFGYAHLPPRAFGVQRQGAGFVADGGALDGLDTGAILALRAPGNPDAAPLAYARVEHVAAGNAQLVPVAHAGLDLAAAGKLGEGATYAGTQVAAGLPLAVRVARPPAGANTALDAAIARIEKESALLGNAPIGFVAAGGDAELYLQAKGDTVWFAEQAGAVAESGRAQPPSLATMGDADAFARALGARLSAFARSHRLLTLMRSLESAAPATLKADVAIDQHGRRPEAQPCGPASRLPPAGSKPLAQVAAENGGVAKLQHCDVAYVTVRNEGSKPVDMTPLYFDRDYGISYLESGELEGIRIPAGGEHTYIAPISTFDAGAQRALPLGLEELVIVAVPRQTGQERPASYAYLAQAGAPRPSRAASEATPFDQLVDAAGFADGTQRSASVGSEPAGTLRFRWLVTAAEK